MAAPVWIFTRAAPRHSGRMFGGNWRAMHAFLKSEFRRFLREAVRVSRQVSGTEICGLLIDTGVHLSFIQTRNASARAGSFAFSPPEVRRIEAATKVLGYKVVGTFHSHPVGFPIPGKSDICHAVDDDLMFLFDCIGRDGQLWKIKSGKARRLKFAFLQVSRTSPNQAAPGNGAVASRLYIQRLRRAVPKQQRSAISNLYRAQIQ